MDFSIFALKKITLGVAILVVSVVLLAAIMMYGVTMVGLLSGTPRAQPIADLMYGLTIAWIATVVVLLFSLSYKKGDTTRRFLIAMGAVLLALTLAGGLYPIYYSGFVMPR